MRLSIIRTLLVAVVVAVATTGCSTMPRNPVPAEAAYRAQVPGMPGVRAHAGRPAPAMERDYRQSLLQESPEDFPVGTDGLIRYPHLALSGGGVRSATFGLGVLQAMAGHKLLRHLDYLSTVSGGGFIGGWLSKCIHEQGGDIQQVEAMLAPPAGSAEAPAIRFLRQYSNYLSPRGGMFSADTWTLIGTYARNTGLNLTMLVAWLFDISGLHLAISAGFVLFASACILYETSAIIHGGERNYVMATIGLYLSIYNLFVSLLQLFGIMGSDD